MFEANGKKIVLQEDIDLQCNKFSELMIRFGYSYKSIYAKLMGVQGCYYRSGGKQSAILTCTLQAQKLLGVCNTLQHGAELLKMSKDQMRNLDAVIAQNINNQDFPSLSRLGISENYVSNSDRNVYASENEYWYETQEQLPYDPNTGKDLGWCAGYAYARFNYLFPDCLPNPPGDAKDWLYTCADHPNLEVTWGDLSALKDLRTPCAAISQNPPYGHVLIIEGITFNEDGSIREIFWSESNGEYDTVRHPDGYDTSSYYFTEGSDGVMNKYSYSSGDQLPWVLQNIAGFVSYSG